jgi:phosphoribosylanthranilate isomerase
LCKIKICGLSQLEDADAASRYGADFLGLIFAPSKRQVIENAAQPIADYIHHLPHHPEVVGVFVNLPADEVNGIADYCNLDRVQLSGDESWDYCRDIAYPLIKVIHVSSESTALAVMHEIDEGYRLLSAEKLICMVDSQVGHAYGGTGKTIALDLLKEITSRFPVIVAGGLTPENVTGIVKTVCPWGVDTSSGVESGGDKDIARIKAFITAARAAGEG